MTPHRTRRDRLVLSIGGIISVALAVASVTALLTGCTTGNSASGSDPTVSSPTDENTTYEWGETHQGEITLTVSEPTTITTSRTAQPKQGEKAWVVNLHIRNTGDKPFNPVVLQLTGSNGTTVTKQVHDSDQDVNGVNLVGEIPPGNDVTTTIGFLAGDGAPSVSISSLTGDDILTWSAA